MIVSQFCYLTFLTGCHMASSQWAATWAPPGSPISRKSIFDQQIQRLQCYFSITRSAALVTEWSWSSFWQTGLASTWMSSVKMVSNQKLNNIPLDGWRNFPFRDNSAEWGSDKNSTVHRHRWSPPWLWGTPWRQVRVSSSLRFQSFSSSAIAWATPLFTMLCSITHQLRWFKELIVLVIDKIMLRILFWSSIS